MRTAVAAYLCLGILIAAGARPRTMRQVSEIALAKRMRTERSEPDLPIFALRFSPDGRRLAVIADRFGDGENRRNRLVLLDLATSDARFEQFDIGLGIVEDEHGRMGNLNFGWSPSGDYVYANGVIVSVARGEVCRLPSFTVMLGGDVAVSDDLSQRSKTRFTFYDLDCHEKATWDVPEAWIIGDVSPDGGLLAMMSFSGSGSGETVVVNPTERRVLHRFPATQIPDPRFADGGKALCSGGHPFLVGRVPLGCWDPGTGKQIAEFPGSTGSPISAAAAAKRVVISSYTRKQVPFDHESDAVLKARLVWDFGTGKTIASWQPPSQTYKIWPDPPKSQTELCRFAISPDGNYVAEGGGGVVRLYKIEP